MMTSSRRRFTDDQKLEILHQADESGVTAKCCGSTGFLIAYLPGGDKNFYNTLAQIQR